MANMSRYSKCPGDCRLDYGALIDVAAASIGMASGAEIVDLDAHRKGREWESGLGKVAEATEARRRCRPLRAIKQRLKN
jgi:hypothetical protein